MSKAGKNDLLSSFSWGFVASKYNHLLVQLLSAEYDFLKMTHTWKISPSRMTRVTRVHAYITSNTWSRQYHVYHVYHMFHLPHLFITHQVLHLFMISHEWHLLDYQRRSDIYWMEDNWQPERNVSAPETGESWLKMH